MLLFDFVFFYIRSTCSVQKGRSREGAVAEKGVLAVLLGRRVRRKDDKGRQRDQKSGRRGGEEEHQNGNY